MTQKIILNISGMHCASCAANIEHVLKKTDGIISATVNFATEKLNLEYQPKKISLAEIKKQVNKIGYKLADQAMELEPGDHDHIADSVRVLKHRFISTLIVGLPLLYFVMGEMIGLPEPPLSLKAMVWSASL